MIPDDLPSFPRMPGWAYPLAFVFLIFVLWNDPAGVSELARSLAHLMRTVGGAVTDLIARRNA